MQDNIIRWIIIGYSYTYYIYSQVNDWGRLSGLISRLGVHARYHEGHAIAARTKSGTVSVSSRSTGDTTARSWGNCGKLSWQDLFVVWPTRERELAQDRRYESLVRSRPTLHHFLQNSCSGLTRWLLLARVGSQLPVAWSQDHQERPKGWGLGLRRRGVLRIHQCQSRVRASYS